MREARTENEGKETVLDLLCRVSSGSPVSCIGYGSRWRNQAIILWIVQDLDQVHQHRL